MIRFDIVPIWKIGKDVTEDGSYRSPGPSDPDVVVRSLRHDGDDFIAQCIEPRYTAFSSSRNYQGRPLSTNFRRFKLFEQRIDIALNLDDGYSHRTLIQEPGGGCCYRTATQSEESILFKLGSITRDYTSPNNQIFGNSYGFTSSERHVAVFTDHTIMPSPVTALVEAAGRDKWPAESVVILSRRDLTIERTFQFRNPRSDFVKNVNNLCFSPDGLTLALSTSQNANAWPEVIIIDMED